MTKTFRHFQLVLCGVAALAMASSAGAEAPVAGLHLADAVAMAGNAVDLAARQGRKISIVIVNGEGRVILSQRMDGASFVSLDVATGKAITAVAVGVPTALLQQQLASGDSSILSVPGVIAIAGGVPVVVGGKAIAAVGVSGSAPADDEMFAAAARDRFSGGAVK